jgi:hypothetical protein
MSEVRQKRRIPRRVRQFSTNLCENVPGGSYLSIIHPFAEPQELEWILADPSHWGGI